MNAVASNRKPAGPPPALKRAVAHQHRQAEALLKLAADPRASAAQRAEWHRLAESLYAEADRAISSYFFSTTEENKP